MKTKIKAQNKRHLQQLIQQEIAQYGNKCDLNHINTSEIKDMLDLFCKSHFNGNISNWDTSNVVNMSGMFAYSKFNQDISRWNTGKVKDMRYMFFGSKFNQDISTWDISNVTDMSNSFANSLFSFDLSAWSTKNLKHKNNLFYNCPAPVPYWAQVDPEFIPKAIESYELQQKQQKELDLSSPTARATMKI